MGQVKVGTAFDFEFGSSRDSANKTQALVAAAKAPTL
jgi:hypothetical protein